MITEFYDGIAVQVPRQGIESYAPPARRVIASLVGSIKAGLGDRGIIVGPIRVIRVTHEDDPKRVKVHYSFSCERSVLIRPRYEEQGALP